MQGCGTTNESDGESNSNIASNIIVIQNDAIVQEIWDSAQKLSCRWTDRVTKTVSVRPLTIDMLEATEAKFINAQDDVVDVWMDLQQGRWPSSSRIESAVRIGEQLSLIVGLNDPSGQMDLQVRDCYAHSMPELTDPSAFRVQLTDSQGCVMKSKLLGPFVADRSTSGPYAGSTVQWSSVSAFAFPDNMQVFTSCNVEVCKGGCEPNLCQSGESNPSGSALFPEPDFTTTSKPTPKTTNPPATLAPVTTTQAPRTIPPTPAPTYPTTYPPTNPPTNPPTAPPTNPPKAPPTAPPTVPPTAPPTVRVTLPPTSVTTVRITTTERLTTTTGAPRTTRPPVQEEITFPSLDYLPPYPVKPVTPVTPDCYFGSTDPLCLAPSSVPSQAKITLPPNITPPTTTLEPPPPPPPAVRTTAPYVCTPGSDDPRCPTVPPPTTQAVKQITTTTKSPCYQGSDDPDCLDRNPKEEQLPVFCLPGSLDPECVIPGGSNDSPVTIPTAKTTLPTVPTRAFTTESSFGSKITGSSDSWKGDPASHAFHMFHFQRGDGRRGGRKIAQAGKKSKRSVSVNDIGRSDFAQVRLTRSVRVLPSAIGVEPVSSSVEYLRQDEPFLSVGDETETQTFCVTTFSLVASACLIVVTMFGLVVIVVFLAVKYNAAKRQLNKKTLMTFRH